LKIEKQQKRGGASRPIEGGKLFRKYGTTGPAIVKRRHEPIKLMRQGGT